MILLEHEAKSLLITSGISIPKSTLISRESQTPFLPLVLKSQVPIGGRGKVGGIKIVKTNQEFNEAKNALFPLAIKGHIPKNLLAEEFLDIERELYLSLLVDRSSQSIQVVAHTQGGIEIEDKKDFATWEIGGGHDTDRIGQALADYFNLPEKAFVLQDMIGQLYDCFVKNDATLIEINPLVLTKYGLLVAGDAKITLDDAADFRHDWDFTQQKTDTNFVTIDQNGTIATLANGAGLAMATVDAAYDAAMTPANFFDIGGGASAESLASAFSKLSAYPHVKAIVVNIFAGITQSDEVARAIISAKNTLPHLPPIFIRIAGTNQSEAASILKEASFTLYENLEACLSAAKKVVG
jgi:succinyl-CoA synthetase beta subunit